MYLAFVPDNSLCELDEPAGSTDCQKLIQEPVMRLEAQPEPAETQQFLHATTEIAIRSVDLTAPLYLLLMTMGVFRRYVIGRL